MLAQPKVAQLDHHTDIETIRQCPFQMRDTFGPSRLGYVGSQPGVQSESRPLDLGVGLSSG
jgi:hypothetical protein